MESPQPAGRVTLLTLCPSLGLLGVDDMLSREVQ